MKRRPLDSVADFIIMISSFVLRVMVCVNHVGKTHWHCHTLFLSAVCHVKKFLGQISCAYTGKFL